MPAVARDGRAVARAFTIRPAIFASLRRRAFATWMRAFRNFPVGHDSLLASVQYHLEDPYAIPDCELPSNLGLEAGQQLTRTAVKCCAPKDAIRLPAG